MTTLHAELTARWRALAKPGRRAKHGRTIRFEEGLSARVVSDLEKMGHPVYTVSGYDRSLFGRGQVILRDTETGVLCAGSDPRGDGCAMTL